MADYALMTKYLVWLGEMLDKSFRVKLRFIIKTAGRHSPSGTAAHVMEGKVFLLLKECLNSTRW